MVRSCVVVAIAWVLASAAPATAHVRDDLDDPKCARGECRPQATFPVDEDDPKLARGYHRRWPTARLQLSYRYLVLADPYGGSLPFQLVQLGGYPVSRYLRVGLLLTAGASTRESAWLADIGLSVGMQYPWRVSPFLDAGFAVGLVGANIAGRKLASYEYRPTVEVGVDVFVASRFHLTIAVGWSHPVYGGVDATAIETALKNNQTPDYTVHAIPYDTVTVRAGFGL